MKTVDKLPKNYQNNPFFVATDGLDLLFKKAQSVGILLAVVCGLSLIGSLPGPLGPDRPSEQGATGQPAISGGIITAIAIGALFILLILMFVAVVVRGIADYTAARLATNQPASIRDAFYAVMTNFWRYVWVLVVVGVKTVLWSLLFIVPGIIMGIRYSLAGVSFFATDKRGNAAVKDSLALTNGAVLTTFASHTLLNLITLGIIQPLLAPGTKAVLYRQYRPLTDKAKAKPKPHALAWLTFALLLVGIVLLAALVWFVLWALVNYAATAP